MQENTFPAGRRSDDSLEVLVSNLKSASKRVVFSAIDDIVKNKKMEAIDPLKQLLRTSEKLKVKSYAGLALKELNCDLAEDEEKLLYASLTELVENQDVNTKLFGAKVLAQCFPEKSSSQLLGLVTTANNYDYKKRRFGFTDDQFSELLGIITKYGGINTLREFMDSHKKSRSWCHCEAYIFCREKEENFSLNDPFYLVFYYYIDPFTEQPYDHSVKVRESERFRRTREIFHCLEDLLKGIDEKPDEELIEKIVKWNGVQLRAEEHRYVGDSELDKTQSVEIYKSNFKNILGKE